MQLLRTDLGGAPRAEGRALKSLRVRDQIQKYEVLADRLGHQPGDVALAWLDAVQRALDLELDKLTLIRLDEITPGHQAAPEYCAC